MIKYIETLFTPADFATLARRDLAQTTCVVFDVLRATSTIVTALANGAAGVIPVNEIAEALALRATHSDLLLAGERDGLRITSGISGGVDFDLGNSPREFISTNIKGKTIALTTTNGTRALRAIKSAAFILAGSFLNLRATAEAINRRAQPNLILVGSGTQECAAWEDMLGAGALAEILDPALAPSQVSDSTQAARELWQLHKADLLGSMRYSSNGRRLLSMPQLAADVAFCLKTNQFNVVAEMKNGMITLVDC